MVFEGGGGRGGAGEIDNPPPPPVPSLSDLRQPSQGIFCPNSDYLWNGRGADLTDSHFVTNTLSR